MLLAGILVTISFILTSLTLAQVSSLEREAVNEGDIGLANEWRFIHERIGENFRVAIGPEMSAEAFVSSTLPTIVATFRSMEAEKGFDAVIRLAGEASLHEKNESRLRGADLAGPYDDVWDMESRLFFNWTYDGTNDGIIWNPNCEDDTAPAAGCIQGLYIYVHLTDGINTMSEHMLIAVNLG